MNYDEPTLMEQFIIFRLLAHVLLRQRGGVYVLDSDGEERQSGQIVMRHTDDGIEFRLVEHDKAALYTTH